MWAPPPSEAEYYSITSPAETHSFLSNLLPTFSPLPDPTYGRTALPRSPHEVKLSSDLAIEAQSHVMPLHPTSKDFIAYNVWTKRDVPQNGKTFVYLHGINDYGGKFAAHAMIFLEAGYRVIACDLPAHGRSSGLHAFMPNLDMSVDAIHAVLQDIIARDAAASSPSQLFLGGSSLGGLVALMTCIKYGSILAGGLFLCPALIIEQKARPSYSIELAARLISRFAGAAPVAARNKGMNSEDPTAEEQFLLDPATYHGRLRVATGLAILAATSELRFDEMSIPFAVFHGTGDRVTSFSGAERLIELSSTSTQDKRIRLYEKYEHILLRTGKDQQDDQRRQNVLRDMLDFLESR